jgi:hypothetical protein
MLKLRQPPLSPITTQRTAKIPVEWRNFVMVCPNGPPSARKGLRNLIFERACYTIDLRAVSIAFWGEIQAISGHTIAARKKQ